jgi:hypothetical protein
MGVFGSSIGDRGRSVLCDQGLGALRDSRHTGSQKIPLNAPRRPRPHRYRFGMAWEWVAPVATGLVGVAGIASTYLNGRLQTNTSVQLAREERTQNA